MSGLAGISSTVLALLIALFSVLGVLIPIFQRAFTLENSDMVFSFQWADRSALTLLVSNLGNRPGTVLSGEIQAPDGQMYDLANAAKSQNPIVLEPTKSRLIKYVIGPQKYLVEYNLDVLMKQDPCELLLVGSDFTGEIWRSRKNVHCFEIADLVAAARGN